MVAKLSSILFSLFTFCIMGLTYAAEIQDEPIPEPNYVGILVFLALIVGGGVFFMWKLMRKPKDEDKK